MKSVYILGGARTPQGSFMGNLSKVKSTKLGASAIEGALNKANIEKSQVDEVFMGQVVTAGVGQAPARQAALFSGLPHSVPCTTVNKVCGSGLETIILGSRTIALEENEIVISGGMENMSMAPHYFESSRTGAKFGHSTLKDSMLNDGLWDVYSDRPMGNCAEECTEKYDLSRTSQDEYSIESFKRAQQAQKDGVFKSEIVPVEIKSRKGSINISEDEGPMKAKFDKIPQLKPAFKKEGTITAANASTINDGAAALVLASEKYKDQAKFKIHSYAGHAQDPTWFTTAPIEAIKKNLNKSELKLENIDIFEVNEAFAAVSMVAMKELGIKHEDMNIYGGGVSLGHPIGVSGTRIVLSLMTALENRDKKYGLAAICIGGGEALSIIIERL